MLGFRQWRGAVLHACVGVACPVHERCARYCFVDGTREPSLYWLGSCARPGAQELPGFIPVEFTGPPNPSQYALTRASLRRG